MLEIIEELVPAGLHADAWNVCTGKNWYFGQASREGGTRFWIMDLDGNPVFNGIWEQVRPRCESMAQMSLRVLRQYANGNTYGVSGESHQDDFRPGCYTLLYYPMEKWENGWEGETVFHDDGGEIIAAVMPRPNRAVFFDSRIRHAGRAPSRTCPALRVTVAFKLEGTVWEDMRRDVRTTRPGSANSD